MFIYHYIFYEIMTEYKAKLEVAHQLLAYLHDENLEFDTLEDIVYNFIRTRKTSEEKKEWLQNYESHYSSNLRNYLLARAASSSVSNYNMTFNEYWTYFKFLDKNQKREPLFISEDLGVEVSYKTYFTLKAETPEQFISNYRKFAEAFPDILNLLGGAAGANKDLIGAKINSNAYHAYSSTDNLVVYTLTEEGAGKYLGDIKRILERHGVEAEYRTGFDFRSSDSRFNGSHTQMISRIIAKSLFRHREFFKNANETKIYDFVKVSYEDLTKLKPHDIITYLED